MRRRYPRRNTATSPPPTARVARYACQLCGLSFPVPHHGGRGRPPNFCSKECREARAALNVLDKWLSSVAKKATAESWKHIRYELWSLANASPAFQKAMAQRSKEKQAAIKAIPEVAARQKRTPKPTYVVTIGTTLVSDDVYATEAAAMRAARAFSLSHPGTLVDVRTAIAREKLGHYLDGKSVSVYHNKGA